MWEPLLFEDEDLTEDGGGATLCAGPSFGVGALRKHTKRPVICRCRAFRTLLAHLGTRCRNSCVVAGDPKQTKFFQVTDADALQAEALWLIKDVARNRNSILT